MITRYKEPKGAAVWMDDHAERPVEKCGKPIPCRARPFTGMAARRGWWQFEPGSWTSGGVFHAGTEAPVNGGAGAPSSRPQRWKLESFRLRPAFPLGYALGAGRRRVRGHMGSHLFWAETDARRK